MAFTERMPLFDHSMGTTCTDLAQVIFRKDSCFIQSASNLRADVP
jgi:hypothetical protein